MKDTFGNNLTTFQRYYEANVSSLTMFARRFVAKEVAEDIIQDLFLDVWNNVEEGEELPGQPYLFTVVRNKCLNILTREKVKRNYIDTTEIDNRIMGLDYYDSHDKQIINKEEIQYIHDEIDKLPDRCKKTFKMSYFEEKRNSEIAAALDISIRTVEHHLYLGLKTLRSRLLSKGKKGIFT